MNRDAKQAVKSALTQLMLVANKSHRNYESAANAYAKALEALAPRPKFCVIGPSYGVVCKTTNMARNTFDTAAAAVDHAKKLWSKNSCKERLFVVKTVDTIGDE